MSTRNRFATADFRLQTLDMDLGLPTSPLLTTPCHASGRVERSGCHVRGLCVLNIYAGRIVAALLHAGPNIHHGIGDKHRRFDHELPLPGCSGRRPGGSARSARGGLQNDSEGLQNGFEGQQNDFEAYRRWLKGFKTILKGNKIVLSGVKTSAKRAVLGQFCRI